MISRSLKSKNKNKGTSLRKVAGLLKDDKEYNNIMNELKNRWPKTK